MSNVVALRPPNGGLPALPAEIQRRFDLAASAPEGIEPVYLPDAARFAIELRRAITTPPHEAAIESFVAILARFLKPGTLSPEALVEGLAFTCDDIPPQCWTSKTAKEIVRQEEYLPGPSVVRKHLETAARPLWRGLIDLERCARMKPPEPPRPPPTEDERAAVAALVAKASAVILSPESKRDAQGRRQPLREREDDPSSLTDGDEASADAQERFGITREDALAALQRAATRTKPERQP